MIYLISQVIDQSADAYPDAQAFRYNDKAISYSQLSERTNQLARILKAQGVNRGDRVGIFMSKCLEMPISVHGIMKAGAAYVPIDPAAPAHRLTYILQNCGMRVLITEPSKVRLLYQILDRTEIEVLVGVDQKASDKVRAVPWKNVFHAPSNAVETGPMTEMDLAYIMFTSGSTGEPKGIMHTHHSGLSYAKLSAHTYQLNKKDILGNHSPLHFDMSTFEFFSGPLKGACSVLIPEEYTKLPASLSKLMAAERLTIWYCVPFALIQLLLRGELEKRDLSTLRWILFGGEPFPSKYLRALMKQFPRARFSNVYGPAEVNQCTYFHVLHPPEVSDDPVPIGRIWPNSEGMVLNHRNQPAAAGEKGELLVRTPTMMKGYWKREDLNQRAFYRKSPFTGFDEIFYRTGDLVQMDEHGHYKYLGRMDRQIKTRGYRVELDEIEIVLSTHEKVEEAAVFSFPDPQGSEMICAGVTLKERQSTSESELVKYLKDRLPWYAVPQRIEIYQAFSRTATGKIDRKALKEQTIEGTQNM